MDRRQHPLAPVIPLLAGFALSLTLSGCNSSSSSSPANTAKPTASAKPNARPQAVSTNTTRLADVPVTLTAQGNVLAIDEVDIRPQKTGVVREIHVKEGQEVKRGQLLFTLDDREDQANLHKAEAALVGTQTQIDIAQRQHDRNVDLFNKNFVSGSALDTTRNQLEGLQSQLVQNRAAVEQLRAVLSYSSIRAPFDGRVGRIDVRPGSLVLANTTISMVKITRMDPIDISFALAEPDLAALRTAMNQGPVTVDVALPGAGQGAVKGKVVFIENTVDKVSGTIGVKAEVANPQRALWPGQYTMVSINAGTIKGAVVLPPQAVINGPSNRFVYVVKPDSTVAQQPVELARVTSEGAVVKGIEAGVKVVQEGAANLRPGSTVVETSAAGKDREGKRNGKPGASAEQSVPTAEQSGGKA